MYTTTTEDKKKLQKEVSLILKEAGKQKKNEKVQISTEAELLTIKPPYMYNALIYTALRDFQAVKKMKQKDKKARVQISTEAELLTVKPPYSYNALIYTALRDLQAVKKMKQKDKTKKARVQKEAEWKLKIITFRKHLILSPSVFR